MANKTVSNLKELTTVSDNDVLLVETETETLKVTKGNLLREVNEELNTKADVNHTHDGHLAPSRLKGHSWSVLGDSISHDNMHTTSQYWDYVSQRVGGMNIYNYGVSGQRITHFVNRYSQMNYSDVITVFGGVNDWGQSNPTPLGTIDDTDASTFYGALKVLCEGLLTTFSKSLIIFLTPLGNNGFGGFASDKNILGLTVYDYSKAILEVCAKYKIRVIDICANSMLNPYVSELKSLYFVDGLHLNALGHEVLSYLIESEIEKCYIPTILGESVIPVTSISLNKNSHDMRIGDTFMLTSTVLPNNATNKNVVYSVNNSNCTINNGLVTANSVGQSVITATTVDGNYTAKCTVTVLESNSEPDEEVPVPEIVGKTFTGTGFEYNEQFHLRLVIDRNNITTGDSVETRISFSNPTNFKITTHSAANHFGTNDINRKEVKDKVTVHPPLYVQTLDDSSGMVVNSSTGTFNSSVNNFQYINICIMIMAAAVPFGGTVEEVKVLVNGVEQEILLIDTFFNKETYTIS